MFLRFKLDVSQRANLGLSPHATETVTTHGGGFGVSTTYGKTKV